MDALTLQLAAELGSRNITVNAVAPGAVNTGMLAEVLKAGPKKAGGREYRDSVKRAKEGGTPPERAAELVMDAMLKIASFFIGVGAAGSR